MKTIVKHCAKKKNTWDIAEMCINIIENFIHCLIM